MPILRGQELLDSSPNDLTMQIAEGLERCGKMFYESLAAASDNARIAAIAASLANAEGQHLSAFQRMRETQSPLNRCRQLNEEELHAAAKELYGTLFPDADEIRMAVSSSDLRSALNLAMTMETQAAAFYTGLAAGIAGPNGAVLARLADEENEHLSILTVQGKRFAL
jgi:rubrerythrin